MTEQESRKPITRRRLQRMASVLARRQPDLSIILEDVHDPHNVSAVLRSCDATGVADVHLIYDEDVPPDISRGVAAGTHRWLTTSSHPGIDDCYTVLRDRGQKLYATTLSTESVDLYSVDFTEPCAVIFGNESRGLSSRAIEKADTRINIPMMGMAESLNISVACAVILFEAMRQRTQAGMYTSSRNSTEQMLHTLESWLARDQRDPALASGVHFDPTQFPPVWPRTQSRPSSAGDEIVGE